MELVQGAKQHNSRDAIAIQVVSQRILGASGRELRSRSNVSINVNGGRYILHVKMKMTSARRVQLSIVTEFDTAIMMGRRGSACGDVVG